jgi:hypothetical protein
MAASFGDVRRLGPGGGRFSKIINDNCCYRPEMSDYQEVCKITSLFQGMVNPQVNLVQ